MAQRASASQPLVQQGDEYWVVIKTTPGPGTTTGVGGYQTFYVPPWAEVIDAAYVLPDASNPIGYSPIPMKGQAPIAIGDGPVGAKSTPDLIGYTLPGTNALGFSHSPVSETGQHLGTIAGVYADTGIFYSTDPRTAFNSYGAAAVNGTPPLINNSGDTVGEWYAANTADPTVLGVMTLWDSYQLRAYGNKAGPIIDYPDQRGNTPWGLGNAVAGPQSGYAWEFDYTAFTNATGTTAERIQASINIGPWKRIQYPGAQIALDQPGLKSTQLGYAAVDASTVGHDLNPSNPLPGDTKAVRFAIGQLELGRPEFSAVKMRITSLPGETGCGRVYGDAFGGDAGGTDNGKDHIWRYFDPTVVALSPCTMLQKTVSKSLVVPGEVFHYTLVFANNGSVDLPNVTLTDTLPKGISFVSATPPPTSSASSAYTWNLGTVAPQSMVVITNWVKAASIGTHFNNVTARSGTEIVGSANQAVEVGYRSLLQKEKTVTPSAVAAGQTVDYTITVANDGTGGNGVPLVVRDYLPSGFTFQSLLSATLNGASIASPTIAADASNPATPVFTVSQSILPGKTLVIRFRALVGATVQPGTYFNGVELLYEGKRQPPIPEASVTVAGGKIGDTIYRDWDGDGAQSPGEEGIAGVPVSLYAADGTNLLATTTTDAKGHYFFPGLVEGTYVVEVNGGQALENHNLTADPDSAKDNKHTVALGTNEQYLDADFGYQPYGSATIGDKVFEDIGKDGFFTIGSDTGIENVTLWLYADTNGDGILDGTDILIGVTASDANGDYLFTGLAPGYDYIVKVDESDPDLQTYFDDKYFDGNSIIYAPSTPAVSASPNLTGVDLDNDFGFWRVVPGSIGDQVFIDSNGDNLYNEGETPLAGVTVTLYRNGQVVDTAVTGPEGTYLFENLGFGEYTVVVDSTSPGVPSGHSAAIGRHIVELSAGENHLDADFPFVPLIAKAVDKDFAGSGTNLLYTINVNYPGSQLLSEIQVTDALPEGTTFVSVGSGGTYGPYVSKPGSISVNAVPALGMAVYNNNNDTFRYRTYNADDGFSAELNAVNLGTRIQMMAGASSPTTAERVITFMNSARHVYAAIRDGTSWAPVPAPPASATPGRMTGTALTANSHLYWGSAVAYEQNSGHLMLIWNDDSNTAAATDDELRFVTRENGVWGTVSSVAVPNQPQNLRLVAKPGSDELALVFSTAAGSDHVMLWNGTSWGSPLTLDTTGGSLTSVNVVYESQSGNTMVVYGKSASPNLFYRLWNGSSWSAEAAIVPPAGVTTRPQWVSIASDPFSNRIAAGVVSSGGRTWLAVWDGSDWVNVEQATATSLTTSAQNVAVAFETFSGDVLAAYGVNSAPTGQVRYRTWSWDPVAETGAWSAEESGPTATSGNPNVITLSRSPTTDRIMMAINTSGNRANYVAWDGSSWDETVLDAGNTQVSTQQPMIYLWNRASAERSSQTTLTASPTTAAVGSPITVKLAIKSSQTIANVTPTLSVMGGSATVVPSESFPVAVTGGVTRIIAFTVTPTSPGDIHFHATAVSTDGYDFGNTDSNTVLVTPNGATHLLTWDLGANDPGTEGLTAANKLLYAFAGNDHLAFWAFNTASGAWNSPDPADTPAGVTIKEGGALATDGARYLYALRGDATRVFLRYDTTAGAWDDAGIADLPATTDKVVLKGGALTYLNGCVYAFIGNDSRQFWRYDVAANAWSQMANALGTVNNGAGLTTDGVNLYATQGDAKKGFWRYNVAANTWTALTPFADNIGDGGGLVYANGSIYVLRGDGKTTFRRYNITANSWTTLAPAPANIDDGGAIGADGAYLYALRGKSNILYRYDPGANTWTTLATAPSNVGWGGALAFLATGSVTHTTATAAPTLVGGVSQVVLRMTVSSLNAVNNIAANAPTYTAVNGVTATFGAATLVSADDDIAGTGDPVVYEWIATVTPGATPGEIAFTLSNNAGAGASALANSVLVAPALTWTGTVSGSAPAVIQNTAVVNEDGEGTISNVPSGTTETYTTGSIGDFVWHDADGDGVQDPGEAGLSGVRVDVYAADGVTLLGSDVTDETGAYRVGGLAAGSYVVKVASETYPAGYEPTTSGTLNVSLAAFEQYALADFGVWTTVASRTTGTNGLYAFTQLLDGDYRVRVDTNSLAASPFGVTNALGAAMAPTYDLDGANTPHQAAITLNATQRVYDTLDFGYNWAGSIGDTVWWDADADGEQDSGEDPVTNAFVMVYFDFNGNGILDPNFGDYQISFAITDANGHYLVENLPPGPYLVDVYEDSLTTGGIRDVVPTTLDVIFRALGAGEAFLAADFGYYQGARVEGSVFWDDNRNAWFEAVEGGLTNVTVTLVGTDLSGNPVMRTATTDADGHYAFLVPEGDYTLSYSAPSLLAGYPALGDATTATSFVFHAYPGEDGNRTSYDFGVDGSGRLGDTIFADLNGVPGQQTGKPGLADVTVRLYANPDGSQTLNGDETLLSVTVTDAEGKYLFLGLTDGNYLVEVATTTLPTGYATTPTTDPTGALDSQGSTTIVGSEDLTMDFGYPLIPASYEISGTIYEDNGTGGGTENNGSQDGSEPGLANVRVTIRVGTNGVHQSFVVYTDANGYYELQGIPEGNDVTITVDEGTLPNAAYVQTGDPDGGTLSNTWTITNIQADHHDLDFGYNADYATISGTVVDGDGNGFADVGEPPLTNVTITLTYAGPDGIFGTDDDTTATTVTDTNGDYEFTGLVPGNYRVSESDPAGYVSLADADGGNPNIIDVPNLQPGQTVTDRDFEDTQPNRYLGDFVWHDLNGDGVQDAGEPGISNVTVRIYSYGADGIPGNTDDVLVDETETDEYGLYLFENLAPGDYLVELDETTLPAGFSERATADLDGIETPHSAVATLDASEGRLDVDFGYQPPAIIGDLIWNDTNKNGIQDAGEPSMTNIVVSLYQIETLEDNTISTNLVSTMATDEDGRYLFMTDPGTYMLRIDVPAGYAFSPLNAGEGFVDSDFGRNHPYSQIFTVAAGEVNMDFDAGLYYAPTLSVITSFEAFARSGDVFVAWVTAAEYDTAGYWIERKAADGSWTRINPDEPVWSDLMGGVALYELADPGASPGGTYTWRIVEIEGSGAENIYGPYTVTVDGAAADYDAWASGIEWGDAASGRDDDPDGDGLTNFEEFLAGTDPLSANSVLRISSIKRVESGMEIRWTSVAGKVYTVEHAKKLGGGWLPVKNGIVAEGPETAFVLPAADGGFFRIVLTED